jgi:hypothetical protein
MKKFTTILFISYSLTFFTQNVGERSRININNINLPFNSFGVIADVSAPPGEAGGEFENILFLWHSGFFLSGFTGDSLWTNGVLSPIYDYQSGTIQIDPGDPRSALYKVRSDDPDFGQSWQDWDDAVDLGADFYDGNNDGIYDPVDLNSSGNWDTNEDKPDILGNETFWCSYTDAVAPQNRRWNIEPQGIEIKQTIFAFETTESPLSNVIFIRYRIVNTGEVADTLEDVIFSIQADTDLGDYTDDLGGSDTLRNSCYAYNDGSDNLFGVNPPAFLIDFLSGPVTYIPGVTFIDLNGNNIYENGIDTPLDTAYSWRGELGVHVYIGATNLSMSSSINFSRWYWELNEARSPMETRGYMMGLDQNGNTVDPCTFVLGEVLGVDCSQVNPIYWFSGNPVIQHGWLQTGVGDHRSINSLGQFKLIKNEPKEIFTAFIVGKGGDPLNSIDVAKSLSDEIQLFYENNLGYPIVLNTNDETTQVNNFILEQNYPNPFNPITRIKYQIPELHFVTLKVYDILGREIVTLIKEEKPAGSYELDWNATGLPSGVYFYRLRVGKFIESKKMVLAK